MRILLTLIAISIACANCCAGWMSDEVAVTEERSKAAVMSSLLETEKSPQGQVENDSAGLEAIPIPSDGLGVVVVLHHLTSATMISPPLADLVQPIDQSLPPPPDLDGLLKPPQHWI